MKVRLLVFRTLVVTRTSPLLSKKFFPCRRSTVGRTNECESGSEESSHPPCPVFSYCFLLFSRILVPIVCTYSSTRERERFFSINWFNHCGNISNKEIFETYMEKIKTLGLQANHTANQRPHCIITFCKLYTRNYRLNQETRVTISTFRPILNQNHWKKLENMHTLMLCHGYW